MKLVIGGYAQGKLDYVLEKISGGDMCARSKVVQEIGKNEQEVINTEEIVIVNHLHSWIRTRISEGGCPEEEIMLFLDKNPDCILISDEVGNGIVPLDAFEREYRERTGRILIELAKKAEEVERVICGIGHRIKERSF
ncbi:MAG: bifunctional adenosylcobinamide kinase/adenosylcobinamide-phosphate guanylyltransferase [Lachnospiraceae bacterium]|nr:bifunctional adenosylcobinamide kinase/adenosylcobinamide-phosphate guanylyltransferase [Lachnospiraceae bacterium]